MISRTGEPGAHGDGREVARGTVGTDAAATPIGTARVVIGTASFVLTILCVVLAFVFGVANGLLVLATVFLAVFIWAVGAYRATFWSA